MEEAAGAQLARARCLGDIRAQRTAVTGPARGRSCAGHMSQQATSSCLLAARMPPHAPSRHHSDKVLHVAKGAPASVLSCMRYSKLEISHRAHRCAARPAVSARRRRSSSAAPDAATMAAAASFAAWDRRNLVNVTFFTRWAPPPHASACSVHRVHRHHNGRRRVFCDLFGVTPTLTTSVTG